VGHWILVNISSAIGFFRNAIDIGWFESKPKNSEEHMSFWLALSDNNTCGIKKTGFKIE